MTIVIKLHNKIFTFLIIDLKKKKNPALPMGKDASAPSHPFSPLDPSLVQHTFLCFYARIAEPSPLNSIIRIQWAWLSMAEPSGTKTGPTQPQTRQMHRVKSRTAPNRGYNVHKYKTVHVTRNNQTGIP